MTLLLLILLLLIYHTYQVLVVLCSVYVPYNFTSQELQCCHTPYLISWKSIQISLPVNFFNPVNFSYYENIYITYITWLLFITLNTTTLLKRLPSLACIADVVWQWFSRLPQLTLYILFTEQWQKMILLYHKSSCVCFSKSSMASCTANMNCR